MSTTLGAAALDGRSIAAVNHADVGNGASPASAVAAERAAHTPTGHVIMCGLDGIGARIAEQLTRAGESIAVLSEFAGPTHAAIVQGRNSTVVDPVGGVAENLAAAGIDHAKAVICVTGDDLKNLEFALLARQLRPDVRVVTQLSNVAIGRAMRDGGGPGAVLDVAALAAPAIVEACLRREIHEVAVEGEQFQVAIVPVDGDSTLRHVFGDLAPVAVVRERPGSAAEVVACPGRDFAVEAGDRAAMLGTAADFSAADIDLDALSNTRHHRHRAGWWTRTSMTVTGIVKDFDPGLYRAFAVLIALITVSTVVLWRGYRLPGMSLLDALYFSTETVATVGYGDFNFVDQDPWLRIWAIFLMAAGITCTAVLMAFLAEMLISRRLNHAIGRRRARGMSGHVVVVGLGAFGIHVAGALVAAGKPVVVIERDPENRFLADAQALGVPVVFGDATLSSTLEAARLTDAAAVAILTSSDMVNIETALAVRDLIGPRWESGPELPVVVRVFDRSMGQTISSRFGFRHVLSTEELSAPWFVGAALGLYVLGSFSVAGQMFMIGRLAVEAGSGLAGLAMDELSHSTRVIALNRDASGTLEHPPRRGTRFRAGDLAYLVGPYEELLGVLRRAKGQAGAIQAVVGEAMV